MVKNCYINLHKFLFIELCLLCYKYRVVSDIFYDMVMVLYVNEPPKGHR